MASMHTTPGNNNNNKSNTPASHEDHQHIRLACQACQRKKIKCDRSFPCSQCSRSSLQCVPSTRKPRTRNIGRRTLDPELRSRIAKLEGLVESLSGEIGLSDGSPGGESSAPEGEPSKTPNREITSIDSENAVSPAVGRYMGSTFWSSLTTEVQALRDAFEDDQQEEDFELTSPTTSTGGADGTTSANDYDFIICPPTAIYIMPGALEEPSPQTQSMLCQSFLQNVAPLFKIFHLPTLGNTLERGAPYLGHDPGSLPVRVMKASLWFSAVVTIGDAECQTTFGQSRASLLQQYRRVVDVLLAQADLMNTNDLAVLQAFVTTLLASRIADNSRRTWTLTALVVRIARAMRLDHEDPHRTPFENELRRRIWHAIRFLDVYTATDRAAEPLITRDSFTTPRPSNANDSEFDESSTTIPNHESVLTDMAFALLSSEGVTVIQRLNTAEVQPSGETWQLRLEIAQALGKTLQEHYIQYCDMTIPFHRLVYAIGRSMTAGMILRAVRPMQRHVSSVPPRIDSPYVLQIAVDALRENERIYEDPEAERWRWLVWVQWHPLAVALAGLCSIRDTNLANDAWACVDKAYNRHSLHVADTRHGMLWRPIEKLYKKARSFRDAGRTESLLASRPRQPPSHSNVTSSASGATGSPQVRQPPFEPSSMSTGSMSMDPMTTAMTTAMPMDFNDMTNFDFNNMSIPPTGDLSWLDWENIMSDFSSNVPVSMGDLQQPQVVPNGRDWPCVLHSDLV